MSEQETLLLIEKKKKGLMRIVFSRVGMMAILMLIQVLSILSIYIWFSEYFKIFATVQGVFIVVMFIYLITCDMDASAKLTWLFLMMMFPISVSILFWFSRQDFGHRYAIDRLSQMIRESREVITQDPEVLNREELIESGTDDLNRYMNRSGKFPIYDHTETTFFPLGEDKFAAMLEELKKAERFIFMEYFIIDEGHMWGSILKILADKVKQGVDVRVMYDGMCEVSLLPHNYPERLGKYGIKCKPFTPLTPFVSTQYNYRDHRKILVIDGKVAFNGGVNLADEYINRITRFGHWKDTAVMLKGDAVQSFTLMFLQMWNMSEAEPKWEEAKICYPSEKSDGYVMPYCDSPLDREKVGEMTYIDILYRAKSYVHIMTPYLILDNELETALKYAAERGVDVRIILPGIPDKKAAYALAKTHYKSLLESGVKLYEYTPGFVHAKIFVSDDEKAVVGTINMDYRSLYHHFECATYLYKNSSVQNIEADYHKTLEVCTQITEDSVRNEKMYYKVLGALIKIVAPLM